MSRPDPDPLLGALASLRAREVPAVDVADRVMARVSRLPLPARLERRWALGVAASIGAMAAGAAAFAPAVGPIRVAAVEAAPAALAVARGLAVAVAASGDAFLRIAGGPAGARAVATSAGAGVLGAALLLVLLVLAREIRRAPALARSPR